MPKIILAGNRYTAKFVKMKVLNSLPIIFIALSLNTCSGQNQAVHETKNSKQMADKVIKTEEEWKKELTNEEYTVLREKGTERAFTGEFYKNKEKGTYLCAGCGNELFSSDSKYESGSGWPSFWEAKNEQCVTYNNDESAGMTRTEIVCGKCGGHLGHVFDDGPQPTGQRYCVNSVSLDFKKKEE